MGAAVGLDRLSAIVGYLISAGNFVETSANLPQRIAVNCEANEANQLTLDVTEWQATSLKAVGDRYGYGSPAYTIARILLPVIGGIPLVFYPQAKAVGSTSKKFTISPVGTATANATHYVKIAGRTGLDGQFYAFTVNVGDAYADITEKIKDCVNSVLGCQFDATDNEYDAILESKWKGATAEDLKVSIYTNGVDAGITYTVTSTQAGSGVPSISTALDAMKTKWNPIVINSYGTNTTVMSAYEAWNGIPDPENPTGQYLGTVMKPAIIFTGSVAEDPSAITDARKLELSIAICPAPLSDGLPMEAAANMAALFAVLGQNSPELDVIYNYYPDMPVPTGSIGAMADYNDRDRIAKLGCSTVEKVGEKYQVLDFITTYHPDGELVPAYRYCRDLNVAFNIRYGYLAIETTYVKGKVLVKDGETVDSTKKTIRPSTWKAKLIDYYDDLIGRALCVDAAFFKKYVTSNVNSTNPNRLDTFFRTKLSGIVRIASTENEIGFNFGSTT